MGFFDRAKRWFAGDGGDAEDEPSEPAAAPPARDARRGRPGRGDRPPLPEDAGATSTQGVEDALEAREAKDNERAREILRDIDRGGGLRTVLRAAAALEAGDESELAPLLPSVAAEEPSWRLTLQVASALGTPEAARPLLERATAEGAPPWAIAWARALSDDPVLCREGLVELLFVDAALARTVASRDLGLPGVSADPAAAQRYASFAHGRDSIRRFGAPIVASLLARAKGT